MIDFIKQNKKLVALGAVTILIIIAAVNHARAGGMPPPVDINKYWEWHPETVDISKYMKPLGTEEPVYVTDDISDEKVEFGTSNPDNGN